MRFSSLAAITAASLVLIGPGKALAGFRVSGPNHRPAMHRSSEPNHTGVPQNYKLAANNQLHHIITIGKGTSKQVSGFGNDVPMASAFQILLPNDWEAYVAPSIKDTKNVSWQANQKWAHALRRIAVRNDLQIVVNYRQKIIRVDPMPQSKSNKVLAKVSSQAAQRRKQKLKKEKKTLTQNPHKSNTQNGAFALKSSKAHMAAYSNYSKHIKPESGTGQSKSSNMKSVASPSNTGSKSNQPSNKLSNSSSSNQSVNSKTFTTGSGGNSSPHIYQLTPGQSMSKELHKWAHHAGWKLVWHSKHEWPVVQTASFGSKFEDAIKRVIKSMRANGAHLVAHAYSNHVIVISGE